MPHRIRSRLLAFLVVFALALSPAVAAVGRQAPTRSTEKAVATSLASRAWSALLRLFGSSGGQMDPNGVKPATPLTTNTTQPPTTTDLGGQMDPDG